MWSTRGVNNLNKRVIEKKTDTVLIIRNIFAMDGTIEGTWNPYSERFLNGLKPVSDCAARHSLSERYPHGNNVFLRER